MSVLIEDMEMPRTCYDCKLRRRNGLELICPVLERSYKIADIQVLFFREKDCPLIEVPEPHGRLVDADEMFVEFVIEGQRSKRYKLGEKWELNGEEIRSVISRLPTVIPANEEAE